MTHLGYLLVGWGASLGALGFYALRVMQRGRRAAGRVPPERRRWLAAEETS
ncbi:MAG: hypothetical protein ACPHIC_07010 [Acidimicrobiales bacterium]